MVKYEIKQFDIVQLKTTKHIRYLSTPSDVTPDPHGAWSVVGNLGRDLLVCKGPILCRVPVADVLVVGESPVDTISEKINGKEGKSEGK